MIQMVYGSIKKLFNMEEAVLNNAVIFEHFQKGKKKEIVWIEKL